MIDLGKCTHIQFTKEDFARIDQMLGEIPAKFVLPIIVLINQKAVPVVVPEKESAVSEKQPERVSESKKEIRPIHKKSSKKVSKLD